MENIVFEIMALLGNSYRAWYTGDGWYGIYCRNRYGEMYVCLIIETQGNSELQVCHHNHQNRTYNLSDPNSIDQILTDIKAIEQNIRKELDGK